MNHLAKQEGINELDAILVMKKELVLAFRNDEENKRRLKILIQLLKTR